MQVLGKSKENGKLVVSSPMITESSGVLKLNVDFCVSLF